MSKRARHQPGFYATLLNNVCDRAVIWVVELQSYNELE